MFSAYSRRSITLRGVVKYQPGNAPCVLALELTSVFRKLAHLRDSSFCLLTRRVHGLRESFFSSHQVTLKIASQAPDVSSQTLSLCVIGR